ncbi:histone-lysine N-methyltransferase SETMAR [Trichonephila clavipes]|nr:histone-lysine N-methyltransferase SETMAR [Trichonephila clavipes]
MKLGYTIIRPKQKYSSNSNCKGGTGSKKAKTVFSAGKLMGTVFWDSHGVILINYLQKEKTITRAYHASLLDKLKAELAEKRPHLQKRNSVSLRPCNVCGCHDENPRITVLTA